MGHNAETKLNQTKHGGKNRGDSKGKTRRKWGGDGGENSLIKDILN